MELAAGLQELVQGFRLGLLSVNIKAGKGLQFQQHPVLPPCLAEYRFKLRKRHGMRIIAYPVTVKLSADAEWLPEGSGVLLSTDKGYVYIFNQNMNEIGDAEKN